MILEGLEMGLVAKKTRQICSYRVEENLELTLLGADQRIVRTHIGKPRNLETFAKPALKNRPVCFGEMNATLIVDESTESLEFRVA